MKTIIDELRKENQQLLKYVNESNLVRSEFRQSRIDVNLNELYEKVLIENKELIVQQAEDQNNIAIL